MIEISGVRVARPAVLRLRRRYGSLLLGLMLVSLVTNFEASLCMPGMAMGDAVPMAMEMDDSADAGAHCWALVATSDGDVPLCPFSVGGVGPCGTAPPVPVQAAVMASLGTESTVQSPPAPSQLSPGIFRVPTPPPRV